LAAWGAGSSHQTATGSRTSTASRPRAHHASSRVGVDANAIKASVAKGVLKVTVPKPAPAQVKKVEVKTAA
jgi:HSP20 family molecular chaperone IbpA